jgi:hypothetical protein
MTDNSNNVKKISTETDENGAIFRIFMRKDGCIFDSDEINRMNNIYSRIEIVSKTAGNKIINKKIENEHRGRIKKAKKKMNSAIYSLVNLWHDTETDLEVHEFIGISKEEYVAFLENDGE